MTDKEKLDKVFSVYIRRKEADEYGYVRCFTCGKRLHWKDAQCGHYIDRRHLKTRWDEMNCHIQCEDCNCFKSGNIKSYREELMSIYGEEAVLSLEQSKYGIYKIYPNEIKDKIKEYEEKINILNK